MTGYLAAPQAAEVGRIQRQAIIVGVAALAICAIGAFFSPEQFFRAYLAAYQFYLGIALGCFVILMIFHLTGGTWGFVIQRILEAAHADVAAVGVLFIPIGCGVSYLYLWARPEEVALHKDLQHKQIYLNAPFFWVRAALYFILWIVIASLLSSWSRRQDETEDPRLSRTASAIERAWVGDFRHHHHLCRGRLVHVAAGRISLDHLRAARRYGSGLVRAGDDPDCAGLAGAASAHCRRYVSLEVLNDLGNLLFTFVVHLGVHGVVPVHAHLDCQSPLRSDLVFASVERRLAMGCLGLVCFSFRYPFFLAPHARCQTAFGDAGEGGRPAVVHAACLRLLPGNAFFSGEHPEPALDGFLDSVRDRRPLAGCLSSRVATATAAAGAAGS